MSWIRLTTIATGLALLLAGSARSGSQDPGHSVYDEQYRPQVHFSPQKNWTNDPNGLVFFEGEYHLFFQYNPFGDLWGHMSWGHAVSRDLLHWNELPIAIPEFGDTMIFTGSVVVDEHNTSGFCKDGKPCMVAVYTGDTHAPSGHRQTQNVAYSLDRGRTWKQFDKNPVINDDLENFRDPSVSWDEARRRWIMAVALPVQHKVRFYASSDLKRWELLSEFGPAGNSHGVWECPDLIRIPAADRKEDIWALKVGLNPGAPQGGSGEQYFLGSFDGSSFKVSEIPGSHGWTNYGKDDYCAIGFNGLPRSESPVLLGWMSNWDYAAKVPTSPWRGQMSIARRLSFLHDRDGLSLVQEPVVAELRQKSSPVAIRDLQAGKSVTIPVPFELKLQFQAASSSSFGLKLVSDSTHWTEIGYDRGRKEFFIDRTHAGISPSANFAARTSAPVSDNRPFDLDLVVDRSSVEAFAQGGTIAMTQLVFPVSASISVETFGESKGVAVQGQAWKLDSIWRSSHSHKK